MSSGLPKSPVDRAYPGAHTNISNKDVTPVMRANKIQKAGDDDE
eukprot:CAMPEP_0118680144 /NCGR_PEP_ID=MMETSP0800-20121206/4189_1 /TAXON_ID=210618 ORGANISM="Striatella unipunctata, Strain CCMP2910" /NCGR_SAMPLE_ID=MMETSP0800 /ASSEMBLY_ACC=CAM_ASM_000638 /LENGTH=43 /DNA_ID= /DNA_START= /DNA_END= /DNA_ORIENTATION=